MFIATTITNQSKLHRSETGSPYTLRSYGAVKRKPTRIYKHFIPTGLFAILIIIGLLVLATGQYHLRQRMG
jgi:hypothetical protein